MEIRRIKEIRRKNDARLARFERLQESLESHKLELIRRGIENIKELDRIEAEDRAAAGSSEVPFNPVIALEQFSSEIPES